MKYSPSEKEALVNAIGTMVIYNPIIYKHIDSVLSGNSKKITPGMLSKLKDLIYLYINIPKDENGKFKKHKRLTDTFIAYCINCYYKTMEMFSDELQQSVIKFIKNGGIKNG